MTNLRFHIFGVPDGFDMLSGTPEEIMYFQKFYDSYKNGAELRVNRKTNGETCYSYLVYNLISCKDRKGHSREGSFLGMSVVFTNNEYCRDVKKLYALFEYVYNEKVLKENTLLTSVAGDLSRAQYLVNRFEEKRDKCEEIGRVVINNIENKLAGSIAKYDQSFQIGDEQRIVNLPVNIDNDMILKYLRQYSWVSLSSEIIIPPKSHKRKEGNRDDKSGPETNDMLTTDDISQLNDDLKKYLQFVIKAQKGQATKLDISNTGDEIKQVLGKIEKCEERQPELTSLYDEYFDVYKNILDLGKEPTHPDEVVPHPYILFLQKWLPVISAVAGVALVVVLAIVFWPSKEAIISNPEPQESVFDEQRFYDLIRHGYGDYGQAWSLVKKSALDQKDQMKYKNLLAFSVDTTFKAHIKDTKNLETLKQIINDSYDYNDNFSCQLTIIDAIQNGKIIELYKANDKYIYDKEKNEVSVFDTITCKLKDRYICVTNDTEPKIELGNGFDDEEFIPKDSCVGICLKKPGTKSITINGFTIKFNVLKATK